MSKEMLINVSEGEECRIALLEKGRLQELYMERTSATSHVGNIYKGRVTNVEATIQAAFIDFGLGRNGFLHISDLMPSYFGRDGGDIQESVGRKLSRRDRPPIQRCLRRGDEIIVQIIKEGIGTKGPTLSTYISIPGRIIVMMPGMAKFGVSRKIEDDEERHRLRMILDGLKPIKDVGFIIRTAGIGKTGQEIERDLTYLTRLWENIQRKMREPAPVELYTEGDLVTRTVRDAYSSDLSRIVVDNLEVGKRIQEFFKIALPKNRARIELYDSPVPLFHQANIEREIDQMNSRHVPLPSGGSLVIDSTEAVVAIDVNSGKFRDHNDAEMTAFKTDMEAADEIPRQLKLRDLGGVIICDFIDLRFERNRRELEERLHNNFKNDRAKTKVLRMSQFGIIELTRQRMRPSLKRSIYFDCPHCKGGGLVKTPESMSLDVMRRLAIAAFDPRVARIELTVGAEVGVYVLNKKRAELTELESESGRRIIVRQDASLALDDMRLKLYDARDGSVYLDELGMDPNEDREGTPRRVPAARRERSGRSGRPLPPRRGQGDRDESGEPDELDDAEDAVDRLDSDLEAPLIAATLKPRAISRVPLGRVVGKLLTDDGGLFDAERESSVIEVDEPHEPLGDGPQEFEEDRWNPRGPGRGRDASRNADRDVDRSPDRGRPNNRFDNRGGPARPPERPSSVSPARPPLRPPVRPPLRPPVRPPVRPGQPVMRDPTRPPTDHADMPGDEIQDEPDGNRIDGEHPDDRNFNSENGDGQRRRRRRGRRGRGRGRSGQDPNSPADQNEGANGGPGGEAAGEHEDDFEGPEGGHGRDEDAFDDDDAPDRDHVNAAFGTSDSNRGSGNNASGDSVGLAGEEIDAAAIDSEFDDDSDDESMDGSRPGLAGDAAGEVAGGQPGGAGSGSDAGSDAEQDRPRRRRRRGGRRHRRHEEGAELPPNAVTPDRAVGEAVGAENSMSDDDGDDDRLAEVTPFPHVAEDDFDEARDALNDSLAEGSDIGGSDESPTLGAQAIETGVHAQPQAAADDRAAEGEKPSRSRGSRRGRSRSPRPADEEAAAPNAEPTEQSEPAEESEPGAKPKSRGGRATGARGGRRAPRKPPVADAATPSPTVSASPISPAASVERSGSTDRHLVDDIPVDPEPPRRLRSYEDLDAVPDDFD